MKLQELMDKRASLVTQMRALLDLADKEKRDNTADELKKYDDLQKDFDATSSQIKRIQDQARIEASLESERDTSFRPSLAVEADSRAAVTQRKEPVYPTPYAAALFNRYARVGRNNLGPQFLNALQVGTDSEGGYIVPQEFETAIVTYLEEVDPIRARATVIRTGNDRYIPVETDRGDFAYISEEGSFTEDDPVFGRVTLAAYKMGGIVKVSEELLQDAFFDVGAYLQDAAARRFANLEMTSFAAGNGSGKPTGIFATSTVAGASVQGFQGATSASAAIASDDLIETFHKLGVPYRMNAAWVTSDTMAKMIRKLKDSTNQYLWQPGLLAGQPDTLMGKPFLISGGATAPAVSAKSIMFGDLSRYYIVERLGISMQRLDELYAANGQVGFRFSMRHDGKLTDAKALVYFQHGAAS